MKIGVITFSNTKDNYGQILQIFALQQYLKKLGHEPFLIRYKDSEIPDSTGFKIKNLSRYIKKFPTYVKWFFNRKTERRHLQQYLLTANLEKRDFEGFIKSHIDISSEYDSRSIHTNPPKADAYICGSDQIWGGEDAYYLSFAPDSVLKIAYAPSLGGLTQFSTDEKENIKKLIHRLDKIGMREESGVDVCKNLGRSDVVKVVDPTLLLNIEDYKEISTQSTLATKPYALIYLLGNPVDISIEEIFNDCRRRHLEPIYVASQGRSDKMPKIDPTIGEWLGLIENADLVITNSFHCTVFALQYERPFISIPLSNGFERMNTRIVELLDECGLNKWFTKDISTISFGKIPDFTEFKDYKISQQSYSKQFLCILNDEKPKNP